MLSRTALRTRALWSLVLANVFLVQLLACKGDCCAIGFRLALLLGSTSSMLPDSVSEAELRRMSVMADAMKLFLIELLMFYRLYWFMKRWCLRKKAFTVARIPHGPP